MQTELLNTRKWRTRTELSTEIFDWITLGHPLLDGYVELATARAR